MQSYKSPLAPKNGAGAVPNVTQSFVQKVIYSGAAYPPPFCDF